MSVRPTSVKILRKQSFLTEGVKVQIVCEVIWLMVILTEDCLRHETLYLIGVGDSDQDYQDGDENNDG